jgi:hypothetical protein
VLDDLAALEPEDVHEHDAAILLRPVDRHVNGNVALLLFAVLPLSLSVALGYVILLGVGGGSDRLAPVITCPSLRWSSPSRRARE